MKKVTKFFLAALFAGMCSIGYAQEIPLETQLEIIKAQIEANAKDDCPYRINGVCSTEDIGGVDVDFTFEDGITWAVFTNYNDYYVTVLYQIACPNVNYTYGCSTKKGDSDLQEKLFMVSHGTCGSMVLRDYQQKKIKLAEHINHSKNIIDHTCSYSIMGLIVRKLRK